MKNTKERIIGKCLEILRRDDVKSEIKNITRPIISIIFNKIYPYIVFSFFVFMLIFLLVLGIFISLMRQKKLLNKLLNI